MRTHNLLRALWPALLTAVLLLAACQPIQVPTESTTQTSAPQDENIRSAAGEPIYADPQGRFTVPVPVGWQLEETGRYGVLRSPNSGIEIYVMAFPAPDLIAAVDEAWATVDPDFGLEPDQVIDEPARRVERAVTIAYDTEDEDRFALGGGWLFEGTAYITLVQGDLVTVQQRASQMQIVLSGFDILALEDVDLSGVEPLPVTQEITDALDNYIQDAMSEFGIPGAAIAIVQGDEIVYTSAYGVRNPDSGEAVTPSTRMMIGSTSKTLTTMLMAMMVDDGRFEWDTPVVDVLPAFAVASSELTTQITVENLVCACTGVPRRDFEIFFNFDTLDAESIIESLATFTFFTDFGEAFQYSNQMVATGGYVAAAAAGGEYGNLYEAYAALVQDRVLDPVGMPRTTLDFNAVVDRDNYAIPHELAFDGAYRPIPISWERFVTPVAPAGAYWSTVEDMGRYLITELNQGLTPDGQRIVSTENLGHTWEPQVPIASDMYYGLGWIISDYKGQRVISHGGNTVGFTSELAFLPEADIGISVLTNAWGTNPFNEAVRGRLLELVFQQEAAVEESASFVFETRENQRAELAATVLDVVDQSVAQTYEGRYQNDALGAISLTWEDGRLMMDVGEFIAELRPVVDDEGQIDHHILYDSPLAGTMLDLTEDEDGNPIVVLGQGVAEYTFEYLGPAE